MTPAVYGSLVGPLESSRSTILGAPLPRRAVLRSFTQTLQPGKMRQQGGRFGPAATCYTDGPSVIAIRKLASR